MKMERRIRKRQMRRCNAANISKQLTEAKQELKFYQKLDNYTGIVGGMRFKKAIYTHLHDPSTDIKGQMVTHMKVKQK